MTTHERQPAPAEQSPNEPGPAATCAQDSSAVVSPVESGGGSLLPLSEQLAGQRFARDINAKIDDVEDQVQFLVAAFSRSQQALKGVMADMQSQATAMTSEIERVMGLVSDASGVQEARVAQLEERLKTSVSALNECLASVDDQLQAHQGDIAQVKLEVDDSHARLVNRIQTLETDITNNLEDLARQDARHETALSALAEEARRGFAAREQAHSELKMVQQDQLGNQQAMADHLASLQSQTDTQADGLALLETETEDYQRQNRRDLRLFAGISAAVAAVFAGVLIYLEHSPSRDAGQLQAQLSAMDAQVGELEASAAASEQQFVFVAANQQGSVAKLDDLESRFGGLERAVIAAGQLHADESENLAAIASKVAALELSLYGEAEESPLATPALTIETSDWVAERDPGHYSIQLLGAYREGSIIAYANENARVLGQYPLSATQSEYRGRSWYNLFYGDFATFSEALSALDALPPGLRDNGPWIRTLSSIQASAQQ